MKKEGKMEEKHTSGGDVATPSRSYKERSLKVYV
jgi:hypothetical protein